MILTIKEIRDLALFCGLKIDPEDARDEDTEVCIDDGPTQGVFEDDGETRHFYKHVAWFLEYPEEGCNGLGAETTNFER